MLKLEETDVSVSYRFYVDAEEAQPDSIHLLIVTKYGICLFSKVSENFTLDEKTDPYFFEQLHMTREVAAVKAKLLEKKGEDLNSLHT